MFRHAALQDLSRDHYDGLVACLHVTRAIEGHPRAPQYQEAADSMTRLWRSALHLHFDEEDTLLLPILDAHAPQHAAKLRADHAALRQAFAAPRTRDDFAHLAANLRQHIRWEEDVLFMWLQDHLSDDHLQDLWQRSRALRMDSRGPTAVQEPR